MSSKIIKNIGQLITNSDKELGILYDASMVIENGKVAWIGTGPSSGYGSPAADISIDANNGVVTPGFVDSHTHAVFAGDRHKDYVSRMSGTKYEAGGIRTTVEATRVASEAQLKENTQSIINRANKSGTTTFEIKSGYGLDIESEVKILKIAKEFTDETTFLGAHVIPKEFADNRSGYVDLVKGEMLDACLPYAKWIDVFCDENAFNVDEAREILIAGITKGLKGRIHGNQLANSGGADLAVELKLASVDHCTHVSDESILKLADAGVVATLLPGAEFFTKSQYPDAKRYISAGVEIALATDCNPGSSFITSMPIVMAIAIREMNLTPSQAFFAATMGGAKALQRNDIGHLNIGAKADFVIWDAPTYDHIPYRMGEINSEVFISTQI